MKFFNVVVTESDRDTKVRKLSITSMTVRQMSWACDHVAEMLLILSDLFSAWLIEAKSLYRRNQWLKYSVSHSVSATLGLGLWTSVSHAGARPMNYRFIVLLYHHYTVA